MLTEDYIMRLINQALAVILAALGLKKSGKYYEALQSFDRAKEILLGLDAHLVDQLDEAAVLDRLTAYERLDIERSNLLADIYKEEGEVYSIQGREDASQFAYQRSLRLYLESALFGQEAVDVEFIQKIEMVRRNINVNSLGEETCLAMLDYFDRLLSSSDDFLLSNGLSRADIVSDYSKFGKG